MANSNDVLRAIESLTEKLYGKDGFEGDIPEIKKHLNDANKSMLKNTIRSIKNETSIKWIIRILVAAGVIGGGATGLIQWLS